MKLKNAPAPAVVSPAVTDESILTPEQVAERLQVPAARVYEWTRRRNMRPLPSLKAGRFLRFKWSMVEKWLEGAAT
jgi:excisionase family DNA binding protein